jgi:hypothetical protein
MNAKHGRKKFRNDLTIRADEKNAYIEFLSYWSIIPGGLGGLCYLDIEARD